MMGVYIKGMEMPKNCAVCRLEKDLFGRAVCFGYEDGRALYKDDLPPAGSKERRPSWCPLVPVPPHGRLGDLDELYVSLKKWLIQNRHSMTEATRVWIRGVLEGIAAAPTIIPAEEGET